MMCWHRYRINGRRLGTARPFPLWRLHSGPQSSSVDRYSETPPEHLALTIAEAMRRSVVVDHRQIKSFIQLGNIVWQKREARGNCLAAALILSIPYPKRGGDVAMPEWLDRALFCILVALAVLFVGGCIAGVLGAFS